MSGYGPDKPEVGEKNEMFKYFKAKLNILKHMPTTRTGIA